MARIIIDDLPRSREEAKRSGSRLYYSGEPCSEGHTAPIVVRGNICTRCQNDRSLVKYREKLARGLPCAVEGCLQSARTRGYCDMHYQRTRLMGGLGRTWRYKAKAGTNPRHCGQPDCRPAAAFRAHVKLAQARAANDAVFLRRLWARTACTAAKGRAERAGVAFALSIDLVVSLATDTCPITASTLTYAMATQTDDTATVDRIIPDRGYVPGNVVVMSMYANRLKSNGTAEHHRLIAALMDGHLLPG